MKFKRKIRQPKKAKKVTLARIRDIVKEELSALQQTAIGFQSMPLIRDTKSAHNGEERPMHFPPSTLKPVPPPPRVSAKRIADLPPIALPDEHEIEEEKI